MTRDSQEQSSPAVEALLDGALDAFAKHGFAKTSMSDVATISAVSRTSLYKHFPTKEDLFKALSEKINRGVYEEIIAAYESTDNAPERLVAVVNARVSWVYDLLHRSVFARELINEKNRICGHQVLAANDRFARLVHELLADIAGGAKKREISNAVRVLISAINGLLESAETAEDAKSDVEFLVRLYIQGLQSTIGKNSR